MSHSFNEFGAAALFVSVRGNKSTRFQNATKWQKKQNHVKTGYSCLDVSVAADRKTSTSVSPSLLPNKMENLDPQPPAIVCSDILPCKHACTDNPCVQKHVSRREVK